MIHSESGLLGELVAGFLAQAPIFQNAHRHVADGVPQTIKDEKAAHIVVSRLGRKDV